MQPTNSRKKKSIRCIGTYIVLRIPHMVSSLVFLNHILNNLKDVFIHRDHFQFYRDF